jgi:hypothetical protein
VIPEDFWSDLPQVPGPGSASALTFTVPARTRQETVTVQAARRGMFTSAAGVMARPPDTEHPQQPAPGMERIWDDGGIRRYRKRAVTEPPGARPARETIVSTTTGTDERSCTRGHVNAGGAKFCSACGEKLLTADEQREAEDRLLAAPPGWPYSKDRTGDGR